MSALCLNLHAVQLSRLLQVALFGRERQPLRLQREGGREQRAAALGLATETVKLLLRDGRFYEAPERYEGGLSLAVTAHQGHWTRSSVNTAAERQAINDAPALALTRADLLD